MTAQDDGCTDVAFVRALTVNSHSVSGYFAGLQKRLDRVTDAGDAAERAWAIFQATGSTSGLLKHAARAAFSQAIRDLSNWHNTVGAEIGLVYPTDSTGSSLINKVTSSGATVLNAMQSHYSVIQYNLNIEVERILADAGLNTSASCCQFDGIFDMLEAEMEKLPAETRARIAIDLEALRAEASNSSDNLVKSRINLSISERIGDISEISSASKNYKNAQLEFDSLSTKIDSFQKANNLEGSGVTNSHISDAINETSTFSARAVNALDMEGSKIDVLADSYHLSGEVNQILAVDNRLDKKFGLATDVFAISSMIAAMTSDDFRNASEIVKAQTAISFIGVSLDAVANGLALSDLDKLGFGAASAGTAFIVTGALLKLDGLQQALDDPNLSNAQRTALEAEFALQTTAVTLAVAQGAVDLAIRAGVAGSKYLLKASPIISCVAAVATTINPSKWAEFASKEEYIDVVEARGDYSSEVLGDALSNSLKIEQDYYIAKTVVDSVFTLASGIMMASGVGAPIAFITGAIGGIASLIMSAIEEARLEKLAEKTLDDITDGGTRSIDDFFQESLEKSFGDTQERYTPIFDKLLDDGGYDSAVLVGNETLTQTDLELIMMARIDGQVTNYAGNFGSSYTLDDGWQDDQVHIEEDQFAQNKVILEDDDGDQRYVTFSTPLLEKHLNTYTRFEGEWHPEYGSVPDREIINIGTFNGWLVADDDQGTSTTFDISQINNELCYEDRYVQHETYDYEVITDQNSSYWVTVDQDFVWYTGNMIRQVIDFSIDAKDGDDTYIAHGSFVNFNGGDGIDTAIYSAFSEDDLATGIVIENYAAQAAQIGTTASGPEAGAMRVITTMAAGTYYTRESIVIRSYNEGQLEKEEVVTEAVERTTDEEIFDDLISVEEIVATSQDDRIDLRGHSGNGNSVIEVHGLAGDDEIFGDTTTNIITGGAGDDVLDISWRLSETRATFHSLISQLGVTDLYISNVVGDGLLTRAQADALQQTVFDATGMWASETLHEQLAAYANGER
ncbi:hypothetical protein, partial [Pseudoruegeria sp. HB172150]|uniref:hypothetical protein n=1 Tax=Pseudoruegeria sp. HB172150 TaxID=2721164 RepID=UPI00155724A7